MKDVKNLYIVTGKGGVGKTLTAFALTKNLIEQGREAKYLVFKSNVIHKDYKKEDFKPKFDLPAVELDLLDCAIEYVARKMKSETVARWIVKTPFFRALINMLPGFSYLIFLGKTMDLLKENPNLTLILDSPSSGHALTMFESTQNYKEIFQSGLLFEDTKKVIDIFYRDDFSKSIIVTLPTQMALNEGLELEKKIKEIQNIQTSIICNNVFSNIEGLNKDNLPNNLKEKLNNEQVVVKEFKDHVSTFIPYITEKEDSEILNKLSKYMEHIL